MTFQPVVSDDRMYLLLKDRLIAEFNERRAAGEEARVAGCDCSSLDLRGLEADGLDLRDARLDHADLRGIDLSGANLAGATLYGARVSGARFPAELPAAEIGLSLEHGTRLRPRAAAA
jgi:uncharacterized protein YjbI with pentapeptide repeats